MIESVFAMMLRWETITARGVPVEPEVYIKIARSSPAARGSVKLQVVVDSGKLARSKTPRTEAPERSVTRINRSSAAAYRASTRCCTKANRASVLASTSSNSARVTLVGNGTATIPASKVPRYAPTQKAEFSAMRTTRSPFLPPVLSKYLAIRRDMLESSPYVQIPSNSHRAGRVPHFTCSRYSATLPLVPVIVAPLGYCPAPASRSSGRIFPNSVRHQLASGVVANPAHRVPIGRYEFVVGN